MADDVRQGAIGKPLFRTTIVIWSERATTDMELSDLARDAESGASYCSVMRGEWIAEPEGDPSWDGTDFFQGDDYAHEGTNDEI